ncbi:unnamed protein product [Amoebophrya sp. A120]|nr:unnamed protein product [Amoebophrya sp. A120]|eukprot:GSA120T00012424001.1
MSMALRDKSRKTCGPIGAVVVSSFIFLTVTVHADGTSGKNPPDEKIYRLQLQKCRHHDGFSIHGLWPEWAEFCDGEKFDMEKVKDLVPKMDHEWFSCAKQEASSRGRSYSSFRGTTSNTETTVTKNQDDKNDWFWTHEWKRHGTCSEFDEHTYFQTALQLFEQFSPKCDQTENLCHFCLMQNGRADSSSKNKPAGSWVETKCPYWRGGKSDKLSSAHDHQQDNSYHTSSSYYNTIYENGSLFDRFLHGVKRIFGGSSTAENENQHEHDGKNSRPREDASTSSTRAVVQLDIEFENKARSAVFASSSKSVESDQKTVTHTKSATGGSSSEVYS